MKLVHFMWVQGPKLPHDLVKSITNWQIAFPDYAICLWVDAQCQQAISAAFERQPAVRVSAVPPRSNPAPWLRNYAASSDLFRDRTLAMGGAYFDSDAAPVGPPPPSGFMAHVSPRHLADLATLKDDSLWTQPPDPLLQRLRS